MAKNTLILGAGRSGLSAARLVKRLSGIPIVYDEKAISIPDDLKDVKFEFGSPELKICDGAKTVIISPGFPATHPLILRAVEMELDVVGELAFGCRYIKKPMIAVTGTNGKTTTVSLIGQLLKGAGLRSCVAGNNGVPITSVIDDANSSDWVVLEVSSFQMEFSDGLHPDIALWLNLTPDHLYRHGDIQEYAALKAKLFRSLKEGGVGIINGSDFVVVESVKKIGLKNIFKFSSLTHDGMDGWVSKEGELIYVGTDPTKFTYSTKQLQLIGRHNYENVLGALLAISAAGVDLDCVRESLSNFTPPDHRLKLVREIEGVKFYNDSKATNVDSALVALSSFDSSIIWIAGGRDKGSPYKPLEEIVRSKVKAVIALGEAAFKIESELKRAAQDFFIVKDLKEAVKAAFVRAKRGDVVLFSPACSSYDMFGDYEERGRAFMKEVMQLK